MITRRKFMQKVALGAATSGMVLAGCQPGPPVAEAPAAASTPLPTSTPVPLPAPTFTPLPTTTGEEGHPQTALVRARHESVWKGEELSSEILLQMLDASIAALTGIQDAGQAWKSLFKPGEKVAIKVNAMANGSVHVPLAMAVTQRLQDSGIAAEQITIYDRTTGELQDAGFPVNRSGKGVGCYSSDNDFLEAGQVISMPAFLNRPLMECDALINIGILKGFTYGGISFVMKNHYGSVNSPSRFHDPQFAAGICGLNALPQIKDRTRLVIGDLLTPKTVPDSTNYVVLGGLNSILMSRDPVAMDAVGLDMVCAGLEALGMNTKAIQHQAGEWLKAAGEQGLGVSDTKRIAIREINL